MFSLLLGTFWRWNRFSKWYFKISTFSHYAVWAPHEKRYTFSVQCDQTKHNTKLPIGDMRPGIDYYTPSKFHENRSSFAPCSCYQRTCLLYKIERFCTVWPQQAKFWKKEKNDKSPVNLLHFSENRMFLSFLVLAVDRTHQLLLLQRGGISFT